MEQNKIKVKEMFILKGQKLFTAITETNFIKFRGARPTYISRK